MAVRPSHAVTRLAVERARSRVPGFSPDSVEVVELVRGRPFLILRMAPSGVVVFDERGRLVRGRDRLGAVGRHLHLTGRVQATLEEARLERRREHVEHSIALLRAHRRVLRSGGTGRAIAAVLDRLEELRGCLDGVCGELERQRSLPPTERTLRRTVVLLNDAAEADRRVVFALRRLAAELAAAAEGPVAARAALRALRRWLATRLAGSDLPFFYAELDERDGERFVDAFVASARAS